MNLILFLSQPKYTGHQSQRSSAQQRSSQGQGGDQRQAGSSQNRDLCKWFVTKHVLNTKPRRATCRTEITYGDLKLTCDARWMPPHKTQDGRNFTVPRTFHFCLKWDCVNADAPKDSTIKGHPSQFSVDTSVDFTPEEWEQITLFNFSLDFDN